MFNKLKCKWSIDYVNHGITRLTEKDGTERPQCILCSKVLSFSNLKRSRLKEHFDNRHGGVKSGNDLNTLKIKMARFHQSGTLEKHRFLPIDKPLLHTSCKVAFLCDKKIRSHTVAEELVKPCAMEMAKSLLELEAEKKLSQVPLSNDIITSRIRDMSEVIFHQIIADLKASSIKVSLQLDKSTDVCLCGWYWCMCDM